MNILEKLTLIDPQILLNGTKTSSNSFLKSCLYMDTTLSSKSSTGIFDPASNQTKQNKKFTLKVTVEMNVKMKSTRWTYKEME